MTCSALVLGIKRVYDGAVYLYSDCLEDRDILNTFKHKYYKTNIAVEVFTDIIVNRNCHLFNGETKIVRYGHYHMAEDDLKLFERKYEGSMSIEEFLKNREISHISSIDISEYKHATYGRVSKFKLSY